MIRRLLCLFGFHHWRYEDELDPQRRVVFTFASCQRPGCLYGGHERIVNLDHVRGGGHPSGISNGPMVAPSAGEAAPTGNIMIGEGFCDA